jgi:glycolate oxidase FAD binding subunit
MSMAGATLCSQLAAIAGSANIISDPSQLTPYEIDGKAPVAAVRPASSEEVVEVVKFALSENLAVVASGARTKLGMGMPPRRYDLAVDVARLARVTAYDPQDLTLGVESGISLREITNLLAGHRQFLPLAVPFADRATVGGTVATGVDGPLRQFYGTARDYVLGMEFVTGAGVLAKSGGRVVKNVSGYDIHKVMIGALGTLGIMTKVNFRTFPLPESMRALVAEFKIANDAIELRHHLARSPFTPLALEILSPRAAEMLSRGIAAGAGPAASRQMHLASPDWNVVTVIAGNEKVLERFDRDFGQMAEQSGATGVCSLGEDETRSLFGRMKEFVPGVLAASGAATIMKISVLVGRMKEMFASAIQAAEASSLEWSASARGLGVIYLALLANDRTEETRRRVVQATERVFAECSRLDGNATIPWCAAEWKNALRVWGPERADLDQMRRLKKVFDPNDVFSPGRFVGGI